MIQKPRRAKRRTFSWRAVKAFALPAFVIIFAGFPEAVSFVAGYFPEQVRPAFLAFFEWIRSEAPGFLLLFVIAVAWDSQLRDETIIIEKEAANFAKEFIDYMHQMASPREFMAFYAKKYFAVENSENFFSTISDGSTAFRNASVRIILRKSKILNKIEYSFQTSFEAEISEYIIAVVPDNVYLDKVCDARCVTDAKIFREMKNPQCLIEEYIDSFRITCCPDDTSKKEFDLKFRRMNDRRSAEILPNILPEERRNVVLFQSQSINTHGKARYISHDPFVSLSFSAPYIFWYTNRPMYINNIEIDATNISEHPDIQRIFVHPNIPNIRVKDEVGRDVSIIQNINIRNWLFYGQGIIVCWRGYE